MSFIESYKHLDKICGEMFETQYGVSAYIEEMLNNPHGSFLVRGWENDLKQLKHYRWIRNQIVHEPDCYEETMCEAGDDEWLDNFYERIINQTDPLQCIFKQQNHILLQNPHKITNRLNCNIHILNNLANQNINQKRS